MTPNKSPSRWLLKSACTYLIVFVGIAVLSGCADKTEAGQLLALRKGFTYRQYHLASSKGLPLSLSAYHKGQSYARKNNLEAVKDLPELTSRDICIARILLAFGALTANKNTVSLAETDILEADKNCTLIDKQVATSLRAVVFHRNRWPGLADAESAKVRGVVGKKPEQSESFDEMATVHLAFAIVAVQDNNWDAASVHIDALALLFKEPWLSKLPPIGIAIKEKRIADALRSIKALSQDPGVPENVRVELAAAVGEFERQLVDIDGPALMQRLIIKVLWETAKSKGSESWRGLVNYLDGADWTDTRKSIGSGVDAASESIGKIFDSAKKNDADVGEPNRKK